MIGSSVVVITSYLNEEVLLPPLWVLNLIIVVLWVVCLWAILAPIIQTWRIKRQQKLLNRFREKK